MGTLVIVFGGKLPFPQPCHDVFGWFLPTREQALEAYPPTAPVVVHGKGWAAGL